MFDILAYRNVFRESKESKNIFTFSISAFTEKRSSQLFLISIFNRHLKDENSISSDIFRISFNINDFCKNSIDTSIMSEQPRLSRNVFSNLDFTSKQTQILLNIIFATVDTKINRFNNELRELLAVAQFAS